MTAILLDTNALLWLVSAPDKISDAAHTMLADQSNELFVSAASAWEIAIKTRLGRLDGEPLLSAWGETLTAMNTNDLAMDSADATLAGRLNWDHRDPFDRMLVAQAVRRGLTIATSDDVIADCALTPVLDTTRR
ncbi:MULTISPECIES: type II toxin-antitoxin system VapC family toxin [unclassified Gordonia (in: high G+C Gram-positive bacteria)]|uniref:type II toxin-antitoxin system VapC family toxin n=1 Tax=unclassified Gordonia (in: high G+C Gram-positive bacteria) TaxID=2657482 RepID=UPI001F0E0978|nr:type II toxin-antitoxin system VapC family toxin [Gordonia sp. ABSL49_1]MCH5641515.1 type II toxin-antitoxin system VapC family toxin [Gordonia sp. ABSL49_1]